MPKKVILDVDPGIDDAMVLCMALYDPEVEIVALTAVGGNVPPQVATRNLHAIVGHLDPPRLPRLGSASEIEGGLPVDGRHVHGIDGLGGASLPVAETRSHHPAEKVICDAVRSMPNEITLVSLGPLTNLALALQLEPELPHLLDQLVIMGGAVKHPGNITPAAEFNMYCDPKSAKTVFLSRCTKTLIPLDVTDKVTFTLDHLDQLPENGTKIGKFLRSILMPAFRAYRQRFGLEGIHIHDMIAYVAMKHPEWFSSTEMAGDVETEGMLTTGMTVFDRRRVPAWRKNLAVAFDIDMEPVLDHIMRGLHHAARAAG
jgi:purine nucleosidase